MTRDGLRQAVLDYEKQQFYRRTRFDKIFPDYDLEFTATGRYDEVLQHIEGHKYYMNLHDEQEIPFERAMRSWFGNVYQPIVNVIRDKKLVSRFPGRTEADLYVWLVKHWDELKRKSGGNFPLDQAASDLSNRFGRSVWQQIRDSLRRRRETRERKKRIARGEILDD